MIYALKKSDKWCLYRYNKQKNTTCSTSKIDKFRKVRNDCYSAGFMYKRE